MEANIDWWTRSTTLLEDVGLYRHLVGKLIYLIVTRLDIAYAVSILSQFMHAPRLVHLDGVYRVLTYIKHAPGKSLLYWRLGHLHVEAYSVAGYAGDKADRKSHGGYAIYVGGSLVTWRSQKQYVVSRSSAKSEYRAMAYTATKMVWLRSLLIELGFPPPSPMRMYCDNEAATFIASNDTFRTRTKHFEIDSSAHQLADIFTKALVGTTSETIGGKLGMFDLHAPA
ncbi:secreted RxLR effector protein 161-like [Wolffia australiana]